MAGKFEFKSSASGKYMFNLKASNGQVILTSKHFDEREGATSAAEAVRSQLSDGNFERRDATDGSFYFVLSADGRELGRSQMYASARTRDAGIASVQSHAPGATVVESE